MKRCSTCRDEKPESEFARNRVKRDGLQNECRGCHRASVAASIKRHPARNSAATRAYRQRHPEQVRAHSAVARAVRSGTLVRPAACDECGGSCKPDAHHDDYSQVLNVRWLCEECHHAGVHAHG